MGNELTRWDEIPVSIAPSTLGVNVLSFPLIWLAPPSSPVYRTSRRGGKIPVATGARAVRRSPCQDPAPRRHHLIRESNVIRRNSTLWSPISGKKTFAGVIAVLFFLTCALKYTSPQKCPLLYSKVQKESFCCTFFVAQLYFSRRSWLG